MTEPVSLILGAALEVQGLRNQQPAHDAAFFKCVIIRFGGPG